MGKVSSFTSLSKNTEWKELTPLAQRQEEMKEGRYVLFDALWYADILHGNKLCELCQIKDVSNFLTEF